MQRGQAMVEYVLVLAILILVSSLFTYFFQAVYRHEYETATLLSAGVP